MEIHPVDIVISILNIAVLFVLLRVILWKHVNRFLTERTNRVQGEFDNAAKTHQDAEALLADYKQKIADFEQRGDEIIEQSREKAAEEHDQIINDAKERAGRLIAEAEVRIELEKQQALKEAQLEIAQLATEMAAGILKREVTTADNAVTVEEFFKE